MLEEVVEQLRPQPGKRFLDGTVGLGGHSFALLERAGAGASLLGLDRDPEALELARKRLEPFGDRVALFQLRYSQFEAALDELGWDTVDGVVLDLGGSSLQLDAPERGFSFLRDGPLDMRMGSELGEPSVADLVNRASYGDLARIIGKLGEEPLAGRIARFIVRARDARPIETTLELAAVVEDAYPAKRRREGRTHPATKTFQALRMAVNKELDELDFFLRRIPDRLAPEGRIAVISFHSLEDRMVKQAFRKEASPCECPPRAPYCVCGKQPRLRVLTRKPLSPSEREVARNNRARSAKLRVAEKLAATAEAKS